MYLPLELLLYSPYPIPLATIAFCANNDNEPNLPFPNNGFLFVFQHRFDR